jgi:hypothetical protein
MLRPAIWLLPTPDYHPCAGGEEQKSVTESLTAAVFVTAAFETLSERPSVRAVGSRPYDNLVENNYYARTVSKVDNNDSSWTSD